MASKISQIASWVHVCSLLWVQRKKWILIRSMGCVHTHPSIVEKTREDNQKVVKIGRIINQVLAPSPKHDKIWAQWASNISSKSMLEKVWWCKRFEMKYWSQTICCLMNCSKGKGHACVRGSKKSHVSSKCCWKGKVLLLDHVNALKRKDIGRP
jgi:hypothetical protein